MFTCENSKFFKASILKKTHAATVLSLLFNYVKYTHWKNALTKKTQALKTSMNMDTWVLSTLNKLFIRGSYTKIKISNK